MDTDLSGPQVGLRGTGTDVLDEIDEGQRECAVVMLAGESNGCRLVFRDGLTSIEGSGDGGAGLRRRHRNPVRYLVAVVAFSRSSSVGRVKDHAIARTDGKSSVQADFSSLQALKGGPRGGSTHLQTAAHGRAPLFPPPRGSSEVEFMSPSVGN